MINYKLTVIFSNGKEKELFRQGKNKKDIEKNLKLEYFDYGLEITSFEAIK
jgi:hypothetical protein